jgi:hypothetical protein
VLSKAGKQRVEKKNELSAFPGYNNNIDDIKTGSNYGENVSRRYQDRIHTASMVETAGYSCHFYGLAMTASNIR